MFGKGDVEGVFLSKRDVGRLQTAGVAWAIEERGDHRVLSEASGTCVFLDPRTKGCGIYDVRPTQCRNFPFTPGKDSPIATRSQWNTAREHCPGIGIGRYYDKRHIRKLYGERHHHPRASKLLICGLFQKGRVLAQDGKADKTGKPGGQRVYSDMAIETGLVVRMVYKLAYRQTEGFLHSIASLLGLGIEIPDYSTLCRRSRLLRKKLRIPKAASTQPIHLMIDSTGLRIHVGNARKPPKQRAWRKLHIAVDRETGTLLRPN